MVFIEITNREIYNEIRSLRKDLNKMKTKIKVNTWIGSSSLSLVIGVIIGCLR